MEGQGARILYALGWGLSRGVPAPAHLDLLAVGRVGPSVQSKPFREMKCWQLGVQLLALTQQSLREHGGDMLPPPWEAVLHPATAQPQSKLSPAGP